MINQIWSGGQTGADQAGLRAAYDLNITTGGWAPLGFWTSKGPEYRLQTIYNLKECSKKGYASRTYANVKDTDATIRFAIDFNSKGELCTLNAIKKYNKPFMDIDLNNPKNIKIVLDWIEYYNICILNVAGNSEKKGLDIFRNTYKYLYTVLFYNKK